MRTKQGRSLSADRRLLLLFVLLYTMRLYFALPVSIASRFRPSSQWRRLSSLPPIGGASPIACAPRDEDSNFAKPWSRTPTRASKASEADEYSDFSPKDRRKGFAYNPEWDSRSSPARNRKTDVNPYFSKSFDDWNQSDMLPRRSSSYSSDTDDNYRSSRSSDLQYSQKPYSSNRSSFGSSSSSNNLRFPIGRFRNSRFDSTALGNMDLFFLGTASCVPGYSRGVSATLFRQSGDCWLFDCGEGTQIQIQASGVKVSKIKKIFITHMHGDHVFGLAGMLCLMGRSSLDESNNEEITPIDIYGPEGLREYVRSAMSLTVSRITQPYRVHELKLSQRRSGQDSLSSSAKPAKIEHGFGERPGGMDIYPDENGVYTLVEYSEEDHCEVKAATLPHTVPCFGFSIQERSRLGTLMPERLQDIVERNREELKKTYGKAYRRIYQDLKELPISQSYVFPDGTEVHSKDFNSPEIRGRKVVILGDTSDASSMIPLSMDADIVVHEATSAWVMDCKQRFSSYNALEQDARSKGHSTPQLAGKFARSTRAKQLILTHFSSRFLGDPSEKSMRIMWEIEDHARQEYGDPKWHQNPNQIVAAWDFMSIPVVQHT